MRRLLEVLFVLGVIGWVTLSGLDTVMAAVVERHEVVSARSVVAEGEDAGQKDKDLAVTVAKVRDDAQTAKYYWAGGLLLLLAARLWAFRRREGNLPAGLLVPAVTVATGLGLLLLAGYYDLGRIEYLFHPPPPAPGEEPRAPAYIFPLLDYAQGVFGGCLAAALLWVVPWAPGRTLNRLRWVLGALALGIPVALFIAGEGSGGAHISLFGIQLVDAAKLLFVLFVAVFLGRRAEHLRYQRQRVGALRLPRLQLLLPALVVLLVLFGELKLIGDLGPTLVLSVVFIGLFLAVTHSWVEFGVLSLVFGGLVTLVLFHPDLLPDIVERRVLMWREPWLNAVTGGDQLAHSYWALASGGWTGRGLGQAYYRALPAGHTDLIQAHLTEVGGLLGLGLYVAAVLAIVFQGFQIARRNRTPERMLLAAGLALLVFAQWLVIFGGTVGLLPLTGIVAPYLSYGRASMMVFLAVVGLLGRLAVGGRVRADLDEVVQVRAGLRGAVAAVVVLALVCLPSAYARAVGQRDEITLSGVLTTFRGGYVDYRYDPRVTSIARRIVRGEIRDRDGVVLAGTGPDGRRTYPLGNAMGTLLGSYDSGISPARWSLEGIFDDRLRGLAPGRAEYRVWYEKEERKEGESTDDLVPRVLFVRPVEAEPYTDAMEVAEKAEAQALLRDGHGAWWTRVRGYDYSPLLSLVQLRGDEQRRAVDQLAENTDARSVRLSVDSQLQKAASESARRHAKGKPAAVEAAAVAVIDVGTGEVLARAQWRDYDPAAFTTWKEEFTSGDKVWTGSYGPWRDKTGVGGVYQAGSIFKLFTALAWVREGMPVVGSGCSARGGETFTCGWVHDGLPALDRPGWESPIHDSHRTPDGNPEVAQALEVSCNVFFGQLGLQLGSGPLVDLKEAGLEVADGRFDDPGKAGSRKLASTAFGQGEAAMHVMEAARMVAAIGGGGMYRKCPPSLEAGTDCETRRLVDDPARLAPILAGMRRVVVGDRGTARRGNDSIPGVRLYGKTGTATATGQSDEEAYGIRPAQTDLQDHSWFVALAEPDSVSECAIEAPKRLAIAAVVPRGGAGSGPALSIVLEVVQKAHDLGYLRPASP
jgi:cell division protein FtsW (lipid II flippase)